MTGQARLEELFLSSYDELLRFAHAMTRHPERAEDVVHDAFLRIWSRPRVLRDPASARSYLFQTVANTAATAGAREGRRPDIEAGFASPQPPADLDLSLDLRQQLAQLPPRRRACLVLRFVLDLTETQTAAALGINVGTVKSQTHKGLRALEGLVRDERRERA